MPISDYVKWLRGYVGHTPVLLASASALIFDDAGRLLLVRPAESKTWAIPGGAIDPGESPVDAVIREALEETGLHIEVTGIFGAFGGPDFRIHYPNGDVADYVMTTYTARIVSGQLHAADGELEEMRFVTRPELLQLPLSHWATLVLPHAFEPPSMTHWWMRPTPAKT